MALAGVSQSKNIWMAGTIEILVKSELFYKQLDKMLPASNCPSYNYKDQTMGLNLDEIGWQSN